MSRQNVAYYVALHGQSGFMPDHVSGPDEFETRRDLVQWIDSELDLAEFSARARRQIDLRRLWTHIQTHGSSGGASFVIHDTDPARRGQIIEFRAMSKGEFDAMDKES